MPLDFPPLVYVMGPSGAGKDFILRFARANINPAEKIAFAHRYITRAPETAGERDDIGVAEGFEGLGREGGTSATGAVDDDLLVVIRNSIFDLGLELAAGDK